MNHNEKAVPPWLEELITSEHLPSSFLETVSACYEPLGRKMLEWVTGADEPVFIGINGAQGTGKSTLTEYLSRYLGAQGLHVAVLSIDDLYLTRSDRLNLAGDVHPLLQTRGVPGTHDADLGAAIFEAIAAGEPCLLPRFDKSKDDRCEELMWETVPAGADLVLFEGWCVGAVAEPHHRLEQPMNGLEMEEDPDGSWRGFVNEQLRTRYQELFQRLDYLVLLSAPDFMSVYRWRQEQERKLAARVGPHAPGIMNTAELSRFVMHYERLTKWMLEEMPGRSDVVIQLNEDHGIEGMVGL